MKKITLIATLLTSSLQITSAQVTQKIVVEHFTNTVCSVCANRNPGFFTNLNSQTGIIHLAVHPSSPYSSCLLNQHNITENDARTTYYGIYGSTPRLVIQGAAVPASANYSSASIFTPYQSQTSPASLRIVQTKFGNDSIRSQIIVKTEATNSLGTLSLFVALAEDTIFYSSPNGETEHYDVFRKAITSTSGMSINLPANVGDSAVYTFTSLANSAWVFSRIYTMAILQDSSSKTVVQAEAVLANSNTLTTGIDNSNFSDMASTVFYAANAKALTILQTNSTSSTNLVIYDNFGRIVANEAILSDRAVIDVSNLPAAVYIYALKTRGIILKTGKIAVY
jgi:hypothetical protein